MKEFVFAFTLLISAVAFSQQPEDIYQVKVSKQIELRGLTHIRYQLFDDTSKSDAFDLRRARLDFRGDVAPKIGYRLQLEFAGAPKILDATFVYKPFDLLNITIGQSKPALCFDNFYSPWNLLTVSRTQIDNSLAFRENDLYGNQNGRELGLWISGKYWIGTDGKKRPLIDYQAGVYNGAGINTPDNNHEKDFGASLGISPYKDVWITGRYYKGTGVIEEDPDVNVDRSRVGGSFTCKYKSILLEGEYMAATDESDSIGLLERNGYYLTLAYTPVKDKLQFVTRLDNYDRDMNIELNAVNRFILAGSWFFTKYTRVQVEYDIVAEEDANNRLQNNLFAIQFQAAF